MIESLVLEHIENPDAFLKRAAGLLSPGGDIFMSERHPIRACGGIFAHFRLPDGSGEYHPKSHPHTAERIESGAAKYNLTLIRTEEICGDKSLGRLKPEGAQI